MDAGLGTGGMGAGESEGTGLLVAWVCGKYWLRSGSCNWRGDCGCASNAVLCIGHGTSLQERLARP